MNPHAARSIGHVVVNAHGQAHRQGEHHADAAAQGVNVLDGFDVLALHKDFSGSPGTVDEFERPVDGFQQGGFAAVRRTDDADDTVAGHGECDFVKRLARSIPDR